MNIKPLGDRIIVKKEEVKEEVRKNNLIVPGPETDEKKKMTRGEVVAIGTGRRNEDVADLLEPFDEEIQRVSKYFAIPLEIGDTVHFLKYQGNDFYEDGQEYKILNEDDILAVVRP